MSVKKELRNPSSLAQQRESWLFLGSGIFSGEDNMALDRELLSEVRQGHVDRPVFRFYQWEYPTVSLGVNQSPERCINRTALEALGYGLVRRPTGGRALLHKGDLCYAIAANRNWHPYFSSLSSTFRAVGKAIQLLLQSLGIVPDLSPIAVQRVTSGLNPCFAMISPFEVTISGRKISGSAQFRSGEWFLQHGSIRVRDDWDAADLELLWPEGLSLDRERITSIDRERGQLTNLELVGSEFQRALGIVFQFKFAEFQV